MGVLADVFTTYKATGNLEDLTSFITDISPLEAPLYDRMGTVGAKGRYHEWQTDSLAAAAANTLAEGEAFTAAARTPTNRYGNYCQLLGKQFTVSDTQNIVAKAGRTSETAYQLTKAAKELKRDFEFALWDTAINASGSVGTTTAGMRLRNVYAWQTSCQITSGGKSVLTASASAVMTEADFNTGLQNIWDEGGTPNMVFVNGPLKKLISGWATSTERVWTGGKKVTNVLSVYESDFGTLETVLDRYVPTNMAFILDTNLYKKAVLVPVKAVPLAKRGIGVDTMLWTQWTVEARNPSGSGFTYSAP